MPTDIPPFAPLQPRLVPPGPVHIVIEVGRVRIMTMSPDTGRPAEPPRVVHRPAPRVLH